MEYEFEEGIKGIDGQIYHKIFVKYCHLNEVDSNIAIGSEIKAGKLLGTCGCSGNAAAIDEDEFHLHIESNTINSFDLSTGARKINPEILFKNGIKK
jgi:hypothetical protein